MRRSAGPKGREGGGRREGGLAQVVRRVLSATCLLAQQLPEQRVTALALPWTSSEEETTHSKHLLAPELGQQGVQHDRRGHRRVAAQALDALLRHGDAGCAFAQGAVQRGTQLHHCGKDSDGWQVRERRNSCEPTLVTSQAPSGPWVTLLSLMNIGALLGWVQAVQLH